MSDHITNLILSRYNLNTLLKDAEGDKNLAKHQISELVKKVDI